MNRIKTLTGAASALIAASVMSVQAFAESTANTQNAAQPTTAGMLLQLAPFAIALVLLYLIMIRPQQKREKEAQAMRENVNVGDEVCTAGGIVGIVIRVEDETVVIETGAERNKIRVKKWAIHENITQKEEMQKAERERKAARQKGITAAPAAEDKPKKKKKNED